MIEAWGIPRVRIEEEWIEVHLKSPVGPWVSDRPSPDMLRMLKQYGLTRADQVRLPIWGDDLSSRRVAQDWLANQNYLIRHSRMAEMLSRSMSEALLGLPSQLAQAGPMPAVAREWIGAIQEKGRFSEGYWMPQRESRPLSIANPSQGLRAIFGKDQAGIFVHLIDSQGGWQKVSSINPDRLEVVSPDRRKPGGLPGGLVNFSDWVIQDEAWFGYLEGLSLKEPFKDELLVGKGSILSRQKARGNYFTRPALSEGISLTPKRLSAKDWEKKMSLCGQGRLMHSGLTPRSHRIPRSNQLTLLSRPLNTYAS